MPSGGLAAYRRSAFERAHGFDERLFAYGEDVDLGLRILLAGGSAAAAPLARGVHAGGASIGVDSPRQRELAVVRARLRAAPLWSSAQPRRRPRARVRGARRRLGSDPPPHPDPARRARAGWRDGVVEIALKAGASSSPPMLRIATPTADPLLRSSNFDCSQVRVPSPDARRTTTSIEIRTRKNCLQEKDRQFVTSSPV